MRCGNCGANLQHENPGGEPLLRNKGLVLKSSGLVVICPKCKSDVPLSPDWMKALQNAAVLFFRRPSPVRKNRDNTINLRRTP